MKSALPHNPTIQSGRELCPCFFVSLEENSARQDNKQKVQVLWHPARSKPLCDILLRIVQYIGGEVAHDINTDESPLSLRPVLFSVFVEVGGVTVLSTVDYISHN